MLGVCMSLHAHSGINLRLIALVAGVYRFSTSKTRFIFFHDSATGPRDTKKKNMKEIRSDLIVLKRSTLPILSIQTSKGLICHFHRLLGVTSKVLNAKKLINS